MWRVVLLCWVFVAPTLAGVLVMITLFVPGIGADQGAWIAYAAILGAILAVPAAFVFAKTQARGLT
jgi:hypothetical protein